MFEANRKIAVAPETYANAERGKKNRALGAPDS